MVRNVLYSSLAMLCGMGIECLGAEPGEGASAISNFIQVVVEPNSALTDKESRELSFAAGRVLKHVAQAGASLAEKKNDQASLHVDQGMKLMAIIDGVLPRYKMKTTINSGELVLLRRGRVQPGIHHHLRGT